MPSRAKGGVLLVILAKPSPRWVKNGRPGFFIPYREAGRRLPADDMAALIFLGNDGRHAAAPKCCIFAADNQQRARPLSAKPLSYLVRGTGFEPVTFGFGGQRSIQLS